MRRGGWALVLAAIAMAGAAGCAAPGRGSADYRGYQAGSEQSVRFGVVEGVRPVRIEERPTGVGTATGAVLGGLAGGTVGRGYGSTAGAVAGAVLGGVIGSHLEQDANRVEGVEITVRLEGGNLIAVVQGADEVFRPGDRVRILSGQGSTRVTH